MGKSLTEVAKGILMNESNDPSPDAGAKSTNPNMATLRPGSRLMEPNPMGNEAEMIADAPKKPGEGDNVGARAAGKQKKDTSVKQSVPAQPPQTMAEEEELDEEDQLDEAGMMPKGIRRKAARLAANVKGAMARRKAGGTWATQTQWEQGNKKADRMDKVAKRLSEEELDEELELSEELESFIDQMIEEGYDEDQIAQAIEENFEILEEDAEDDVELSEELESFINQMIEEGYDEDQIAQAIEENFDLSEEAEDYDYEYSVDMSEHVAALFAGEELSEEFQDKAIAIFEAAVTSTVKSEIARLEEAYAATLEEEVDTIKEELSTNVDDYLNYVVESWVSDNEVAIEAGLRTELTEEFISGLRNLFAENYIDIPEDKISVVEELGDKVSELENKLNEEIERNVELTSILSESKKSEVLYNVVEGLTTTQAEKLKSLAEGVEFTSEDEYAEKILTLRESYFPSSIRAQTQLDNIEPGMEGKSMISEELQGPMARYVEVLGKKLPN